MSDPSATPVVLAKDLVKVYPPDLRAVDGVNLEIRAGEIFGLLGPNGAGKTTTIKVLVTLAKPTSGTASVCGHDVVAEPQKVRECIGYVGQTVALDRSITAWDNLWMHANLHHMPPDEARKRIDEVLALVELADRAQDRVKIYSGGMKKRLDLATGLLHRPRLLVLDEPTLGLDIQTRVRIWEYLLEQKNQGMTILVTTHYLEEADRLCDRLAIIDHGKVQAIGTPSELKGQLGSEVIAVRVPEASRAGVGALTEDLKARPEVTGVAAFDEGFEVYLSGAAGAVPWIIDAAREKGVEVEAMTIARPTLDDVFLRVTGRKMRD